MIQEQEHIDGPEDEPEGDETPSESDAPDAVNDGEGEDEESED